jgi:hypothetical protein
MNDERGVVLADCGELRRQLADLVLRHDPGRDRSGCSLEKGVLPEALGLPDGKARLVHGNAQPGEPECTEHPEQLPPDVVVHAEDFAHPRAELDETRVGVGRRVGEQAAQQHVLHHQDAAGPQQARHLRERVGGSLKMAQKETAERQIERIPGQAGLVGAPLDERDVVEAVSRRPLPTVRELLGADVEGGDAPRWADALAEPARHLAGAAPDVCDMPTFGQAPLLTGRPRGSAVHFVEQLQASGTPVTRGQHVVVADRDSLASRHRALPDWWDQGRWARIRVLRGAG